MLCRLKTDLGLNLGVFPFDKVGEGFIRTHCLIESYHVADRPLGLIDVGCCSVVIYGFTPQTMDDEICLDVLVPHEEFKPEDRKSLFTLEEFCDDVLEFKSEPFKKLDACRIHRHRWNRKDFVRHMIQSLYKCSMPDTDREDQAFIWALSDLPVKYLHSNWAPLYCVVSEQGLPCYLVFGATEHTLESMIKFNYRTLRPAMVHLDTPPQLGQLQLLPSDSHCDEQLRFVIYQLVHAMEYLHSKDLWHGSLRPWNIRMTQDLWTHIDPPMSIQENANSIEELTHQWRNWKLSNLEYLMAVNAAAGRRMSDAKFHPVVPWVTDFSCAHASSEAHWRDLSKSKYRLVKGDDQLDITYHNSPTPHHITESLSEITYYIYMARVTPLATLRNVVRSNFEAKEYPASMQRMFQWTPDECIPEFFTDPLVFTSHHTNIEMPDIQLPSWCSSPEDFIQWHREVLESDRVSMHLHHWIDLNFGIKLSGEEAVGEKNVTLPLMPLPAHRLRKSPGFVQVFTSKHPPRSSRDDGFVDFQYRSNFRSQFSTFLQPAYSSPLKPTTLEGLQREDVFAIGCIAAELYLRKPLFSPQSLEVFLQSSPKSLDLLAQLPTRTVDFISKLVDLNLKYSATEALNETNLLFPPWFPAIYSFLSKYHALFDWKERLSHCTDHAPTLLLQGNLQIANLLKPAFLTLIQDSSDSVSVEACILALDLFEPFTEVKKDVLQVVIRLVENLQSTDKWNLTLNVFAKHSILKILRACGSTFFLKYFLPLLKDPVISRAVIPVTIRLSTAESLIILSKPEGIGPGLSVQYILNPFLDKWSNNPSSNDADTAHFRHFQQEQALNPSRVLALISRLDTVVHHGGNLYLPVDSVILNTIRGIAINAGRATIVNVVLPKLIAVFDAQFPNRQVPNGDPTLMLDILSLMVSFNGLLLDEDIVSLYFNSTFVVDMISLEPRLDCALVQIYQAVLVTELCYRSESSSCVFVMHRIVGILSRVCSEPDPLAVHVRNLARIFYIVPTFATMIQDMVDRKTLPILKYPFGQREPIRTEDSSEIYVAQYEENSSESMLNSSNKLESELDLDIDEEEDSFLLDDGPHSPRHLLSTDDSDRRSPRRFSSRASFERSFTLDEIDDVESNSSSRLYGAGMLEDAWVNGIDMRKSTGKVEANIVSRLSMDNSPIITMTHDTDERILLTSSRSCKIRCWSINGAPRLTSSISVPRPVIAIRMFDRCRKAALLDGTVRIWDLQHEVSTLVPLGSSHRPLLCIERPPSQWNYSESILWMATIAGTLDCLDLRSPRTLVASHKLPDVSDSRNRGLATSALAMGGSHSGGWIAAARPTGDVAILDPRNGAVKGNWRAHPSSATVALLPFNSREMMEDDRTDECGLLSLSGEDEAKLWNISCKSIVPDYSVSGLLHSCRHSKVVTSVIAAPLAYRTVDQISAAAIDGTNENFDSRSQKPDNNIAKSHFTTNPKPNRVYISVPQSDTCALWFNSHMFSGAPVLITGSNNKLSIVPISTSSKNVVAESSKFNCVLTEGKQRTVAARERMKINTLRVLPLHKLLLVGTETGELCSVAIS